LTIFGDMAASLMAHGNPSAAIALESLWNSLTHGLPFFTVCGYSESCLDDCLPEIWSKACREHWAVSHTTDL
jgi:hypothetical protein